MEKNTNTNKTSNFFNKLRPIFKGMVLNLLLTVAFAAVYYFIFRPALNLHSFGFHLMIMICTLITTIVNLIISSDYIIHMFTTLAIEIAIVALIFVSSLAPFHAKALQERLKVTETETFSETVSDTKINSVPRIDKEVSDNLANRKLGELEEVVSQYETDKYNTLINYNGSPSRIVPLKYSDFLKFLANRKNGIPGYIFVDVINQEASYKKLDEAIMYSPSALFKYDLTKRIRKFYPAAMFDEFNFELNDSGVPHWIVPEITANFGFGVRTVENVFVVNAISGEITKYAVSEIPSWIDRALDTTIALSQIETWGKYKDGFLNSLFGQKGVKIPTKLYNFITQDDDVYLYTGITSANGSDQSNVGFFLINMRTGEAKYTSCASVNEATAKSTAEAILPEKGYIATDPLLLNIDGKPTYFTSLKDSAGLVKMYAYVYAEDYTVTGYASEKDGVKVALANYKTALNPENKFENNTENNNDNGEISVVVPPQLIDVEFKLDGYGKAVVNGTTSLYVISEDPTIIIPLTANPKAFAMLYPECTVVGKAIDEGNYYLMTEFEIKK